MLHSTYGCPARAQLLCAGQPLRLWARRFFFTAPETDNRIYSVVLTSQYFYPFGDLLRMLLYSYPTRGPFGPVFSELRLSWVGFGIAAAENCGFSVTCCAEDSELAIRLRRSADPRSRFSVARRGTVVTNRYPLSF